MAVKNDNNTLTIFAPVMGYDSRLATLVYNYTPETLIFQAKKE